MDPERSHFDLEARHYPQEIGQSRAQAMKWELVSAYLRPGVVTADIGAASGRHTLPLAHAGARVVALDLSTEMLAVLRQRVQAERLVHSILPVAAKLPCLPLRPGSFDLLYCFSTLLLLPHDQQRATLRQMATALRPGGILIADLAGARSLALWYWRRHYRRLGFAGIHGWSRTEVVSLIREIGLELRLLSAHGVLSQFLLLPGATSIPGLETSIRGHLGRRGWDEMCSAMLPALAERWYAVARRPEAATDREQ